MLKVITWNNAMPTLRMGTATRMARVRMRSVLLTCGGGMSVSRRGTVNVSCRFDNRDDTRNFESRNNLEEDLEIETGVKMDVRDEKVVS